ncbi:hypothetical protein HMPREF3227_00648 [Corynebacterium sp. CMW7794]|nr:hypothetical protein HMPREF0307_00527 [Corynebacterium sp. DNF00584]KXI19284.1 hypothetical protein HMPREF3227_00648 [Corynebacterium sp. CMW7794]
MRVGGGFGTQPLPIGQGISIGLPTLTTFAEKRAQRATLLEFLAAESTAKPYP